MLVPQGGLFGVPGADGPDSYGTFRYRYHVVPGVARVTPIVGEMWLAC
jgi:hypothetical protein